MGSHSFPKYGLPPIAWPFSGRGRAGRRGPDAGRRRRGQHIPPAGPAAGLLDATRAAFTSGLQVTAVIFATLAQAFSQVLPIRRIAGAVGLEQLTAGRLLAHVLRALAISTVQWRIRTDPPGARLAGMRPVTQQRNPATVFRNPFTHTRAAQL